MKFISSLILLLSFVGGALAQGRSLPRFEEYRVSQRFRGTPAPAIISQRRARLFRTTIKEQAKDQPNFAGHYNIATWGCGTDCRGFALIDARTGRVYFNSRALNVAGVPYQEEDRLQFRPDSRLLIISGAVDGVGGYQEEATFYYVWENNRFRLIRKTKIQMSNSPSAGQGERCAAIQTAFAQKLGSDGTNNPEPGAIATGSLTQRVRTLMDFNLFSSSRF